MMRLQTSNDDIQSAGSFNGDGSSHLQKLKDDVKHLDGRFSNLARSMTGESDDLQARLEQIKEENGEAVKLLETLREKLKEHKRLTNQKKRSTPSKFRNQTDRHSTKSLNSMDQRLMEIPEYEPGKSEEGSEADKASVSGALETKNVASPDRPKKRPPKPVYSGDTTTKRTVTPDSSIVSHTDKLEILDTSAEDVPDSEKTQDSKLEISLENDANNSQDAPDPEKHLDSKLENTFFQDPDNSAEKIQDSKLENSLLQEPEKETQENHSDDSAKESEESSSDKEADKEVEELENKIKSLEMQKENLEDILGQLLKSYDGRTSVLQREKLRLADDKDTTYTEMKNLLIEQHAESERLRNRLSKLQKKRKNLLLAAKIAVGLIVLTLVGSGLWLKFLVKDVSEVVGSLNYACAPARPGTLLLESTLAVESPWWAPWYTKDLLYPVICKGRARMRMEIRRGTLWITSVPDGVVVAKKTGHKARIEADKIFVSDRGGGYQEFAAPWAVPEVKRAKSDYPQVKLV